MLFVIWNGLVLTIPSRGSSNSPSCVNSTESRISSRVLDTDFDFAWFCNMKVNTSQCVTKDSSTCILTCTFLNNTGRKHWDSGLINGRDINTSRAQGSGGSPTTSAWAWAITAGAAEADWTGDPGASNEEGSFAQETAARTTTPSSAATAAYTSLATEARRWRLSTV